MKAIAEVMRNQEETIYQKEEIINALSGKIDEVFQQLNRVQLENDNLQRENEKLKKSIPKTPNVRRNAEYAKKYLKNGQTVTLKLENGHWIKAFWDGINDQFIVHSSYEDGMKFFDDLQDVGKYFVKNYHIKRETFWYHFKDESGNSIAYLHLKKTNKRRALR